MLKNINNISETTVFKNQEVISLDMNSSYASPLRNLGITACGYCNTLVPSTMVRHGDREPRHFNLGFMLKGAQLLETESGDFQLEAGNFMSIPSWITRRFSSVGDTDLSIIFMKISGEVDSVLQSDKIVIQPSIEIGNIQSAFFKVHHEINNQDKYSENIARMQMELISVYLLREFRNLESPKEREQLLRFYKLWETIGKSPAKHWTVKNMAEIMMVSPSHFFALCQRFQNISPLQKVTEIRMNHAKKMLVNSRYNLSEIADTLGYSSEFAFARAFKKHSGTSPGKFRSWTDSAMF